MQKAEALLAALLAVCLLAGSAHAQTASFAVPTTYMGIALLALTISIDVVAIGYVIAKLFPQTGIMDWLQNEYWEIAKSAMIIVGIFAVLTFISSMALILVNQPVSKSATYSTNLYTINSLAENYFQNVQYNFTTSITEFYDLSYVLGMLRTFEVTLQLPIPFFFGITLYTGFATRIYANQLLEQGVTTGTYESMINDQFTLLIYPMSILVAVLSESLQYIIAIGLGMLIPLGIIFRAFPFLRNAGGTLIGIGIAMAVIFPATIIVLNTPLNENLAFLAPPGQAQTTSATSSSSFLLSIVATELGGYLSSVGNFLSTAFSSIGTIYPFLNVLMSYDIYFVLQLVLFILDLVITYTLGDNIARMLGGSLRLSLGGKLKLT
ncbi:MAG: hypothetical protein ACP5T4_00450 [Candidatus Micrarchaeia archaeon]